MGNTISTFFPPAPTFAEDEIPSQKGRVFIVTGGYSGVGYELSRILWRHGGTVYIAGRDESKAQQAISDLEQQKTTDSVDGGLRFLKVALDDFNSIKAAAEKFLAEEKRLDVLFNNAGVSNPPAGTVSAQGHEVQLATNCLAPYFLTRLFSPLLISTAKLTDAPGATRVVFTTSIATQLGAPRGGINMKDVLVPSKDQQVNYATSKTGNWFLADHFAKELGPHGVVSVVLNPGNLKTPLLRHMSWVVPIVVAPLLYHPRFGAYTNLFAGLSPDVTVEDGGRWIEPWGRFHPNPREDIIEAMKDRQYGGLGLKAALVEHCEKVTSDFC
ncbi:putative oxidoreductase [Colletotrichum orbiculare MAFF 240422]|uniref:Oxidoreductase n=1 Tax=Colletotrichum orbiculare (strain 104-T / ATCC 96160 / CBS 514.97 / LARS 414 / MAFF 240422) TaxID=1213857 RepID=A0A484G855_COLOR|nr:putative oxidoreductase [Colletotrichum orbiculare MAFF 240422]